MKNVWIVVIVVALAWAGWAEDPAQAVFSEANPKITDGVVSAWGSNTRSQCTVASPNSSFVVVSGGWEHSVGLKSDGTVALWGSNTNGQCTLPSPNSDFVAIAAGGYHTLGLKSDGSIAAWGDNTYGQCTVPSPNSDFVAVAAGANHSVGLKTNGSIVAWGWNNYGQSSAPSPNTGFVAIAAGAAHTLGLKSDGSIAGWGYNFYGQIDAPSPNSGFVAVAAGTHHSLGIKSDGSVVAWGNNTDGQCTVPSPNTNFVAVSGGAGHTLGLKSDGTVVAWGVNDSGQLTLPSPNADYVSIAAGGFHCMAVYRSSSKPVVVQSPISPTALFGEFVLFTARGVGTGPVSYQWRRNTVAISGATRPTYFLGAAQSTDADIYDCQISNGVGTSTSNAVFLTVRANGSIIAWGSNGDGQCTVSGPNIGFVAVSGGEYHTLALKADGTVATWGANVNSQSTLPVSNADFTAVAAGGWHNLALKSDGSVTAWGYNAYGQCDVPSPNSGFVALAGGGLHSLGLKADGTIVAWGDNAFGQCTVPSPNSGFVAISAGYMFSMALKADGSIVCWGQSGMGQLTVPTPNTGFVGMSAGGTHGLGLKSDGSVVAWGDNSMTQLAISNPNSGRVTVSGGYWHSLTLQSDGSAAAWGNNGYDQCTLPVPNRGFGAVVAGGLHSLAISYGPAFPTVFQHPISQSALQGGTVLFVVQALGAAPLSYQWQKDGVAISGATRATYRIASAQYSDEGNYDCVVSTPTDSSPSNGATLSVNHPPKAPTLTSPVNGAQNVSLTPVLQIGAFSDPDAGNTASLVEFQVASDSGFSSVVVTSGGIAATQSWTVPSSKLLQYKRYWWRARYKDNRGVWGYWPSAFSFDTGNRPPNAPLLTSPVDGAQGVSLTPTLQIGACADPDGDSAALVEYQVALDSGFATIELTSGGIAATQSWTVPSGKLAQYKLHWWRARYKDNRGVWGYWAPAFSFDTGNRPPNAPTLTSPVNGAQNVSLTPALQIGPFSDPDGDTAVLVEFQVASSSGFSTIVVASGGIAAAQSWTVPSGKLVQYNQYWWRARYKDSRGAWGYWPAGSSFGVGNRPPNAPTLTSPASGAQNVSVTPTLQIGAFSDPDVGNTASLVQFQVASDSAFATVAAASGGIAATQSWTVPATKLSQYKRYWWRARYKDNQGAWGNWPTAFSFDTGNRAPSAPLLTSPANGATNVGLTPVLQAGAFSDPDGDTQASGQWQVATSSAFTSIVRDSGGTNTTQTSWTVPAAVLQTNHVYYWHVRYKDNRGAWGAWSAARSFNTGVSKSSAAIREEALPLSIEAAPEHVVGPMNRLAVRLTASQAIDPASVKMYLDGPNGWTAEGGQWWPVDGKDGWAVYLPVTPIPAGMVQVAAIATTMLGEILQSIPQTFEVDAAVAADEPGEVALLASGDLSPLPETAGTVLSDAYRIEPSGAFQAPVTIQVPLDKACALEEMAVYYFSESGLHQGWYPSTDVTGWLAPESTRIVKDKGQLYLELQVNHSGVLQVVTTLK